MIKKTKNNEAIEKLKEILFMTGYKESLDLAIKALRIVDVIDDTFKQDSNLMMDIDDWKEVKEFVDKESENEQTTD